MAQVLIVEDEVLLAKSLSRSLIGRGHDCLMATSAEEGLALLEQMPTDIVLLDIQLPGMTGLEAISKIRDFDLNISVIIATAYATMATAVEAMRAGACDLLRKPLDIEEVSLAVDRAVAGARIKQTISYYHEQEAGKTDEDQIISHSPNMKKTTSLINKVTAMDLETPSDYPPLLILGETGAGKDLIARYVHYRGKFSQEPFIEVNCTVLPKGLEEAELFGYEKGSFTGADRSKRGLFEAASGGTIFLNEVGDLPLETQIKLLQVIEEKRLRHVGGLRDIKVNARVIAATNRDLKNTKYFRADLYYRLNNVAINVPPLRERKEDILSLANLFLEKYCRKYGVNKKLDQASQDLLTIYNWPGNVRELRQSIERAVFLNDRKMVTIDCLGLPDQEGGNGVKENIILNNGANISVNFPSDGVDISLLERNLILAALEACEGNISLAARKLQLGREALRYRIKKHGLGKKIQIISLAE